MQDEDIVDRTEVVIAYVDANGECENVAASAGFHLSPDCEFVDAMTASVKNAAAAAFRAMQRRDGTWRAMLATLPSIRVNTLGDTYEPESDDNWSYETVFPIRIYLQKVEE